VQPNSLQLAVEAARCGIRVILVAGELDRASSARLAELIDRQARHLAAELGGRCVGHIVIDLGNVRFFGVGGLEVLMSARDAGRGTGVALHLAGLGAREVLLPRRVIGLLSGFSTFATLEQALRELGAADDLTGTDGQVRSELPVVADRGPVAP
jgi:anti-anti-sigma factor